MRYAAGQVLKYRNRPGEDDSRLIVLRIDDEPGYGKIVHIAVNGLSIRAPQIQGGSIGEMSHLPFAEEAVDQSVTELVETLTEPPAGEGYDAWREAFEQGQAGVFTVPLGQLIALTEQSMSDPE